MASPLPPKSAPRGRFVGVVQADQSICREHYRLTLAVKNFPPSSPGQFVQLLCQSEREALGVEESVASPTMNLGELCWEVGRPPPHFHDRYFTGPAAYLRRPFSIADRRDQAADQPAANVSELDFIYRVIGKGTRGLVALAPGEQVSLLGPLGHGFTIPEGPDNRGALAILVGGGVGIPPMLYLGRILHEKKIPAIVLAGAQRRDLLPLEVLSANVPFSSTGSLCIGEFARWGIPAIIATDDGSLGLRGYVTAALEEFLMGLSADQCRAAVVFCCGPTPMMKATAQVAGRFGVDCQASLEQPMACGMGTCQSCIVKYQPPGQPQWRYKLTCTDGPVFNARDILW